MDLRERRRRRGLTQTELAKMAGCTRTWINSIECGRRKPGRELLANIERVLDGLPVMLTPVIPEDELMETLHEIYLERYA